MALIDRGISGGALGPLLALTLEITHGNAGSHIGCSGSPHVKQMPYPLLSLHMALF